MATKTINKGVYRIISAILCVVLCISLAATCFADSQNDEAGNNGSEVTNGKIDVDNFDPEDYTIEELTALRKIIGSYLATHREPKPTPTPKSDALGSALATAGSFNRMQEKAYSHIDTWNKTH